MATNGSWIYVIAKERQAGWRQDDEEDRRATYRRPDASPDAPIAASAPDTGLRGRGLSFHGLLHRLSGSSRA